MNKQLTILCPNKSVFSNYILNKFSKNFISTFKNIDQKKYEKICHNYNIILTRHTHKIKYKKNSQIKFILSPTTGLNHIDKKIIKEKKIKIIYLKDTSLLKNVRATAEHTVFLILYLLRRNSLNLNFGFKKNYEKYISHELHNKKVAIIGMGRIGEILKKILKGFDVKLITFDKKKKNKLNLKQIFKVADIITLHINGYKSNNNFISKDLIKNMKKGSMLINTARGEIIDQKQLFDLSIKNNIKLGLDVLKNEQSENNNIKLILKKNKNSIITPHVAGLTKESIEKTDRIIWKYFIKEIYEKKL